METTQNLTFLDALLPMAGIIFIIGMGVVLLNLHFQKNLAAQRLQQQALKAIHHNDLLRHSIHAQEEERRRIALDIHDELGSVISIMRMHLLVMQEQSGHESLLNILRLSDIALASIRSISHQLMPPQLESFGLTGTLQSIVSQLSQTGQLSIDIDDAESTTDLSWAINLALYRIIMELINNTIRHAEAGRIKISIRRDNRFVICDYTDDGKGLPATYTGKGLGHKSIEGRVRSLEGLLKMGNGQPGGFFATIRLPLDTP